MNSELKVRTESLPQRCDICHQSDLFNPETGHCARCAKSNELMERISNFSDEELLKIVNIDCAEYRPEVLAYAETEIERRRLSQTAEDEINNNEVSQENIVRYKTFSGTFASWEKLFSEAAEFASEIGRERLINISQSEDAVTVWYWE